MRVQSGVVMLAMATVVAGFAPPAQAQDVIFGYGGTPNNRTDGGKVVGVSFNGFGQTIASLGFFDYLQDGINDTYQLGIWDSTQTLIGTATVTPSSPLIGDFRWANLTTPLTLGNNDTFTMGVLLPGVVQDVWWDGVFLSPAGGYTGAGTGRFSVPSGTLVYPGTLDSSAYYVVNGSDTAVPVPEPMSAGILGAAALLLLRRRAHSR